MSGPVNVNSPDEVAKRTEMALALCFRSGDRATAREIIAETRDEYPAYADYLQAKYGEELSR